VIYINNLPDKIKNIFEMFADDNFEMFAKLNKLILPETNNNENSKRDLFYKASKL